MRLRILSYFVSQSVKFWYQDWKHDYGKNTEQNMGTTLKKQKKVQRIPQRQKPMYLQNQNQEQNHPSGTNSEGEGPHFGGN